MRERKPRVWELKDDDEGYEQFMSELPTAEEVISVALRESRYVMYRFPPYSSGAGDLIEDLLDELRDEWRGQSQ